MSDSPESKRRLRLIFAIAVLVGAIILIVATEIASRPDRAKENTTPANSPAP